LGRYLTGRISAVHDWPVLGVHRGKKAGLLARKPKPTADVDEEVEAEA
jgi:hypothetical protein